MIAFAVADCAPLHYNSGIPGWRNRMKLIYALVTLLGVLLLAGCPKDGNDAWKTGGKALDEQGNPITNEPATDTTTTEGGS
jgi:hypothetical protein